MSSVAESFEIGRLADFAPVAAKKGSSTKNKTNAKTKTTSTSNLSETDRDQISLKLKHNYDRCELVKVRKMIEVFMTSEVVNKDKASQQEMDFWRKDCERLMQDDWLLSRFMYRGIKRSKANQNQNFTLTPSSQIQSSTESKNNKEQDENNNDQEQDQDVIEQLQNIEPHILETLQLILDCAKFRFEYRINSQTSISEFPSDWVQVNGIFSHGFDLQGNCVIYMRAKLHRPKSITKDIEIARYQFKRLLVYWIEQSDQMLVDKQGKGVCCVFDMSEVSRENLDFDIIQWISQSIKNSGPKLLAYVIIYNLPWFLAATFRVFAANLLYKTSKQTLKFVNGNEILNYIEPRQLPEYLSKYGPN